MNVPTEITLGNRTYEVLGCLREDEKSVLFNLVVVKRAEELNANLGEDDGRHFLNHQGEIPKSFQGEVIFVFPAWTSDYFPGRVACVCFEERFGLWIQNWAWLADSFCWIHRLLRPK